MFEVYEGGNTGRSQKSEAKLTLHNGFKGATITGVVPHIVSTMDAMRQAQESMKVTNDFITNWID
jgi:hypothetical protein